MGLVCTNVQRLEACFYTLLLLLVRYFSSVLTFQAGNDWYYENVAVNKPSIQVDTSGDAVASRANDGNPSGHFGYRSCSMTKSSTDTWWLVDLLDSNYIYAVQMKNRNSHTHGKLRDFYIYVSETNPLPLPPVNGNNFTGEACLFHKGYLPVNGLRFLPCENNKVLKGRYVYLWKPGATGQLYLCELEVLVKYPLRDFMFTLIQESKSDATPFHIESLQGGTYAQCSIFCLNLANATVERMQYDVSSGECFCYETKPFDDSNLSANVTFQESTYIIGRS